MRLTRRLTLLLVAVGATVGGFVAGLRRRTRFGPLPQIEPISEAQAPGVEGNVALYIANMAFEPDTIDMRIEIDGRAVIQGTFVRNLQTPQTRYRLNLAPGKHRLKAETLRGQAILEREISIPEDSHIGIGYVYSEPGLLGGETPPTITYHAEETPWIPSWAWQDSR
jgi:hypothetical protein